MKCNLSGYPNGKDTDSQIRLTWDSYGAGYRYNYVVKTKDGRIYSAVPCNPSKGIQLQTHVDAATTATSVTLNVPVSDVDSWGVYAIAPDKKPATAVYAGKNDNISTSVESVDDDDEPQQTIYYNLQGIRVAEPLAPGLYIANGKKVLVR